MQSTLKPFLSALALAAAAANWAPARAGQDTVQVLHWWTAGGEAGALQVLKDDLLRHGVQWQDVPIAGGGGAQAMTTLRARVLAGDPPSAAQLAGFDIADWSHQGVLQDLGPIAQRQDWARKVPKALQDFDVYQGRWIAAPIDVHSSNWLWASRQVLARSGITRPPATWDEFLADLAKVKKAGFVALAAGGQPWQIATMFDGVVLSTGGPDFYRRSLLERDPKVLDSPTMIKAFERMSALRPFVDQGYANRDWNEATAMIMQGRAGFQMVGDWALGEFNHARQVPGKDYLCVRTPGTQGSVTYHSDALVFFKRGAKDLEAQRITAEAVMSPEVQIGFNRIKGSAPALLGVSPESFNACGRKAIADLAQADASGTLLGSLSQGNAVPPAVKGAFFDVIAREFNGAITPAEAARQLAAAANAQY